MAEYTVLTADCEPATLTITTTDEGVVVDMFTTHPAEHVGTWAMTAQELADVIQGDPS